MGDGVGVAGDQVLAPGERRLVATFSSEQQLLAYVRWATLEPTGERSGKFEQGSVLAGYEDFARRHRDAIVWDNLLPVGARRRNWKQTLVSDGFIMLRHPELAETLQMADAVGRELHLYAE